MFDVRINAKFGNVLNNAWKLFCSVEHERLIVILSNPDKSNPESFVNWKNQKISITFLSKIFIKTLQDRSNKYVQIWQSFLIPVSFQLIFRKVSDVKKEKELAERRKNDPALNHTQDHLVRKLFSKFKRGPMGMSGSGAPDIERGDSFVGLTDNGLIPSNNENGRRFSRDNRYVT